MALMLSGPVLADNSVNDCLDQLKARVSAVPGLASVYGYRSAKATLPVEVAITSTGDIPGDSPVGLSAAYDYIIDVMVRIDDDYEAAERKLNDVVGDIWRAVWGANEPYWSDCFAYGVAQKPASLEGMVNWRRGIMYVRVIPR